MTYALLHSEQHMERCYLRDVDLQGTIIDSGEELKYTAAFNVTSCKGRELVEKYVARHPDTSVAIVSDTMNGAKLLSVHESWKELGIEGKDVATGRGYVFVNGENVGLRPFWDEPLIQREVEFTNIHLG